jgi:uncharacterized protein (DUF302 family)
MLADGTIKYSSQEPFERAVQAICSSLRGHGIRVAGQLDVSRRFQRSLGITLAPCRVIFVLPALGALSTQAIHPWAAVFLPLHIVISGNDCQSEIRVPNTLQTGRNAGGSTPYGPIVEAQRQLIDAIEAVAVRVGILS